MKAILFKLIKDFRQSIGKLALLLLATTLSAWGISSMIYGYYLTERDFEVNFLQTYPADMSLTITDYQEGLEEKLMTDSQVIDIERREAVSARIKDRQGNWMPVIIYAVDDLAKMRYDRFNILDEKANAAGNILIEQNAFYFLSENQDSIEIQFQGEHQVTTWKLSGKVHDARLAPAKMEGVIYAFSTSIDKIEPYLKKGQRRILVKTNVSTDRAKLQKVFERIKMITEQSGSVIAGVNIPVPGEHIHQGVVDSIAFLQESGGAVLTIMGIILLSLILLTWVFPQIKDIGVMKALGASTKHVLGSFTMVLCLIVLIGLMIGLPLGYKTASLYNGFVAMIQNFEVVTSLLPIYVHVTVIVACMAVPLFVGIFSLIKAASITVNQSINKTFYTPHYAFIRVTQILTSSKLKYGLNNLLRHSQRTMLTILLIAVGIGLYFTASNVAYSIRADLDEFARTAYYEIGVILPDSIQKAETTFLNELPFIKSIAPLNTGRVTYIPPTEAFEEISVIRILSSAVFINDKLLQRGAINKKCKDCIYVSGEDMRLKFQAVSLGTPIVLTFSSGEVKTYIFSGVIRDLVAINAPLFIFDDEMTGTFNSLALELTPGLSEKEIFDASNEVDDAFLEQGINLRSRVSVKMRMLSIMNHLEPTFLVIKIMGITAVLLGLLGLLIVLNLTLQERTREIGVMKSIGASLRNISNLFIQEFLIISLLSIISGGLLSIPVAKALINLIAETIIRHPVPFRNDFQTIVISVIVVLSIQTILIWTWNRFKISKNARELLDHNF